jgi:hypothetical protein
MWILDDESPVSTGPAYMHEWSKDCATSAHSAPNVCNHMNSNDTGIESIEKGFVVSTASVNEG